MAPPAPRDFSGYQYNAMSSLVTNADRTQRGPRGDNEPTGEAESLVGRIDVNMMGTRVVRGGQGLDVEEKRKKQAAKDAKNEAKGGDRKRKERIAGGKRYGDVLEATQDRTSLFPPSCLLDAGDSTRSPTGAGIESSYSSSLSPSTCSIESTFATKY